MKVFNIISAVVMLTAIVLSGCSVFDLPDLKTTAGSGNGFVTINIQGSEARTAFPDMSEFTYNASFVCTSNPAKTADPMSITSGTPFKLEEGTWTINIDAVKDDVVVGKAVITGVVVGAAPYQVNNVLIKPVKNGDGIVNGTVELKIKFHGSITDLETVKIFFDNDGTGVDIKDQLADTDEHSVSFVFTKSDVTPGSYRISAVLTNDEKSAGNAEAVHIYSGMTTELEWEFWDTSLVATKTLVFIAPITYSGTIEHLELELEGIHEIHGFTNPSVNQYRFSFLVPLDMDDFEGKLTITTGNGNDIEVDIPHFTYGAGTYTLPNEITIYTLTANVGEFGALEVNGDEYEGVMDFLAGETITLEAIPESGSELATLTVGGTGYTVPFNIAADTVVAATFTPPAFKLALYNQASVAGTTTELVKDPVTNKYTIANTNTAARLDNGVSPSWTSIIGTSIVYFNKPLDTIASISARVKLIGYAESSPQNSRGIIMGLMSDPTETNVYFTGLRSSTNGSRRAYFSRYATGNQTADSVKVPAQANSSQAMGVVADSGYGERTEGTTYFAQLDGIDIPYNWEFIMEVTRVANYTGNTPGSNVTVTLKHPVTESNIASYNINSGNRALVIDNQYAGFIIAAATVEISEVKIIEGAAVVFDESDPPAAPMHFVPLKVEFTTEDIEPGASADQYTYNHLFNDGNLELSARALPVIGPQDISWAITDDTGNIASFVGGATGQNATLAFTDGGNVKVTATAGSKTATLSLSVVSGTIYVEHVDVLGAEDVMAGNGDDKEGQTITLTAHVNHGANDTVTWSVTADDGTTATTAATIDPATGVLKAQDEVLASPVTVNVFATSVNGEGGATIKSNAHLVTVKPYEGVKLINRVNVGAANGTAVYNAATGLTMTGTGTVDGSGQVFNFVYLPVAAGDFTVTVKINSASTTASNSNAARVSIVAIPQSQASGVVPNIVVPTDNTLQYGGIALRLQNTHNIVRQQRATVSSDAGTSGITLSSFSNTQPLYLRLRRTGNNFIAGASLDGLTFTDSGSVAVAFSGGYYVGLQVSGATGVTTAVFSEFKLAVGNGNATEANLFTNLDSELASSFTP